MKELSLVRRRELASKHEQGSCWGNGDLMRGTGTGRVGGGDTTPLVLFDVVAIQVVVKGTREEVCGIKLDEWFLRQSPTSVLPLPFSSVVKLSTKEDQFVLVERVGGQCGIGASTINKTNNKSIE